MKYILVLISAVMVVSGCTRTVYVPTHSREVVIDTLLDTVYDSAVISALLECDRNNRVILRELDETKGRLADQEVTIREGKVEVVTRWRTKLVERVREVRDTTTVVEVRTEIKRERYVPHFYKYCAVSAFIFAGGWLIKAVLGVMKLLK